MKPSALILLSSVFAAACVSVQGDEDGASPESGGRPSAAFDDPAPPAAAQASSRRARAQALVSMALEEGQSYAMLQDLCTVAPGRLSGSPAAERGVEWTLAKMRALGLENVRRERVLVPRWVRGDVERATLLADGSRAGEDLDIAALGGSVPTPQGGITAPVLMVRSFEELRSKADEARGKIVFFNRPMPRALLNTFMAYSDAVPQRSSGASEAARVGGVFALVRSMTTRIDDFPHTGAMNYEAGIPPVPTAAISTVDAEMLAERIAAGEDVRLRVELDCHSLEDVESANVVGELVGTEFPDEIVLIGGHLDSWDLGQGAHDDGAGCIHCLEAVRLIQAAGIRPRRTIRVVLYMNEENGLRGGNAYVGEHLRDLDRHVAAIETDAGGFVPRGFSCSAQGARYEAIRAIVDGLDPLGMGAYIPGGGGADIGPMRPHGVTLLSMMTVSHRYFDFHHSAADTVDNVSERELALGAGALAYVAAELADAELPPDPMQND